MKKLKLELFLQIIGIGSASGLIHKDNMLLGISDNSGYLYEYSIESDSLSRSPLFESVVMENIPKPHKTDFEAITYINDTIYIFGSGSTPNRNVMMQLDANTKTVLATHDMADFYAILKSFAQIADADFNIEGAIASENVWYFFQRGNQGNGKNGIFTVTGDITGLDFSIVYNQYKLPKLGGIETSFTDATIIDNTIYFLATAENTNSAYDDGEVMGSIIGQINIEKMKIGKTRMIPQKLKFEGLTTYDVTNDTITFLLCDDNDSETLESAVYKLSFQK